MAEIKQFKQYGETCYPVTVPEAVIFEDGSNLKNVLEGLCSPLIVEGVINHSSEFFPNADQPSAAEFITQLYKGRSVWIKYENEGYICQLRPTQLIEEDGIKIIDFNNVYWMDYSTLPVLEIDWNTPDENDNSQKIWYGNYDLNDEQRFFLKINDYDSSTTALLTFEPDRSEVITFRGGYYNSYTIKLIFNDPNIPNGNNYVIVAYIELS